MRSGELSNALADAGWADAAPLIVSDPKVGVGVSEKRVETV